MSTAEDLKMWFVKMDREAEKGRYGSDSLQGRLNRAFKYIGFSGYWTDTMEYAARFNLRSSECPARADIMPELEIVLPYVTKDVNGEKKFDVMTDDLSYSGNLMVYVGDTKSRLTKTTYGRESTLIEGTIEEVLVKLCKVAEDDEAEANAYSLAGSSFDESIWEEDE